MTPYNIYTMSVLVFCVLSTLAVVLIVRSATSVNVTGLTDDTVLIGGKSSAELLRLDKFRTKRSNGSGGGTRDTTLGVFHDGAKLDKAYDCVSRASRSCNTNSEIVIFTHSALEHVEVRTAIRETWGAKQRLDEHKVQLYFVVGTSEHEALVQYTREEAAMHGDMLVLDVTDSYHNLTLKALCALDWIQYNCMHTRYVVKTDDDVYLNISRLVQNIFQTGSEERSSFLFGHVITGAKPQRDRNTKYFTPYSIYRGVTYPPFLSGSAYVMPTRMTSSLLNVADDVSLFWLEDVHVTGTLRKMTNTSLVHSGEFYIAKHINRFWQTRQGPFISVHSVSVQEMYYLNAMEQG